MLQNPSGVKPIPSDLDFQFSLSSCKEIGAEIICLSETNTSWNLFSSINNTKRILHQVWKSSTFQVSQCAEKFRSTYQPGGTATIIANNWTSRITDRGEDPFHLGRWSYITLTGQWNKLITLITAYWPSSLDRKTNITWIWCYFSLDNNEDLDSH